MTTKTTFSNSEFETFLKLYRLGSLLSAEPASQGTVQTNYFITTTQGKFVFRYYENRTKASVLFEIEVLRFLEGFNYCSPVPLRNVMGEYVGQFKGKPFVIFTFLNGSTLSNYHEIHQDQLIQKVAELQNLTVGFKPQNSDFRWNYSPALCRQLAFEEAQALGHPEAKEKFAWLEQQLDLLQLPDTVPKGICHCDFHFSNVLFEGDVLTAVLDFDDANYTYTTFDLVCLVENWAWEYPSEALDFKKAAEVVANYSQHRPLSAIEQHHFFDVYKLSILIDCVWFFARGSGESFYERKKIEFLNRYGREQFKRVLFKPS